MRLFKTIAASKAAKDELCTVDYVARDAAKRRTEGSIAAATAATCINLEFAVDVGPVIDCRPRELK
jgi:hypothetical protein